MQRLNKTASITNRIKAHLERVIGKYFDINIQELDNEIYIKLIFDDITLMDDVYAKLPRLKYFNVTYHMEPMLESHNADFEYFLNEVAKDNGYVLKDIDTDYYDINIVFNKK